MSASCQDDIKHFVLSFVGYTFRSLRFHSTLTFVPLWQHSDPWDAQGAKTPWEPQKLLLSGHPRTRFFWHQRLSNNRATIGSVWAFLQASKESQLPPILGSLLSSPGAASESLVRPRNCKNMSKHQFNKSIFSQLWLSWFVLKTILVHVWADLESKMTKQICPICFRICFQAWFHAVF